MKYIRLFGSTSQRDAVLASIDYKILQKTMGVPGVSILQGQGGGPVPPAPSYSTPFYVENITNEVETLTISCWRSEATIPYPEIPVEYSTDGTNWSSLGTTGATQLTRTLQPGDKVYLRAITNVWYNYYEEDDAECECTIEGVSKVGGNIMSLLYGSSFTGNETTFPNETMGNFIDLLSSSKLVDASELILPATTLTFACYNGMFNECRALTTAPALPATTLAPHCYGNMFSGCASLTTAPVLPATTLTDDCYRFMFNGCISLTTAPVLPATTLADGCYQSMFIGCTKLNYIKCLATDISASRCTEEWLNGVAASGTFVKDPSMSSWITGNNGIPSGWTVQDAA